VLVRATYATVDMEIPKFQEGTAYWRERKPVRGGTELSRPKVDGLIARKKSREKERKRERACVCVCERERERIDYEP
jgi:hypothetical protein